MERFGRYVLLEKIATGGMGEVFRAAAVGSAGFTKAIAIKRILPHLAEQQDFVNMLIDEAKISATLTHPNILQVLDLGRHYGLYFIAMEFVAGQAVNRVIGSAIRQKVRLPIPFAVHVVHEALRGLAFAHEKQDALGRPMGIIHRDISPQNIMVAYDGSVKLADFGIAKAAERSTHTSTGNVKGKPGYLSPEQVRGTVVDQRMDIYAMGVVLHELLTMSRMRRAATDMQVLMEVAAGTVPRFEDEGAEIPGPLAEVAYKALAAEPSDRYQTAREFMNALNGVIKAHGWEWQPLQMAAQMLALFPVEIERERQADAQFASTIAEVAAAAHEEISDILSRSGLPATASPGQFMTPTGQSKSPEVHRRPWFPAAVALVAALGVGAVFLGRSPATGNVVVETDPPGATITVNGVALEALSPTSARNLAVGPVDVEARLQGRANARRVVQVDKDRTVTVNLELAPLALDLPVTSEPSGAVVSVDGVRVGVTPTTVHVAPPSALVSVQLAGRSPAQQRVEVAHAPARLEFVLAPAAVAEPAPPRPRDNNPAPNKAEGNTGLLTVQSTPWAKVFVDGKDTGLFTPVGGIKLSAGKHTVKLVNDEMGATSTSTVVIKAGATVALSKTLK